jgi:RNA polymerase-binding protein DksA
VGEFHPFTSSVVDTVPQGQLPASREPIFEDQRRALLALRARLHGDVAQAADDALAGSLETSSASPDAADRALETVEQDIALSLLGSVSVTLDRIDAALKRIDDGGYGRCVACKREIPAARLEAIPYADCCVHCAARRERAG